MFRRHTAILKPTQNVQKNNKVSTQWDPISLDSGYYKIYV
jgi:hypothetical protein